MLMKKRDYRHKIDFLERVNAYDEHGEPIDTWTPFKSGVWASKDPLLGNEMFTALTLDTKVEVKFNMHYFEGVTDEMRIKHGEEVYEILSSVNVSSLNRELLCYCKLVK